MGGIAVDAAVALKPSGQCCLNIMTLILLDDPTFSMNPIHTKISVNLIHTKLGLRK